MALGGILLQQSQGDHARSSLTGAAEQPAGVGQAQQPQPQKLQKAGATPHYGAAAPAAAGPTLTVLKINLLHPDTPPTIEGWAERALLYVGFLMLCAPMTCALGQCLVYMGLGLHGVHKFAWGLYLFQWGLLALGLLPKVGQCLFSPSSLST